MKNKKQHILPLCSVIFLDSFSFFIIFPILLRIIYQYKQQFFSASLTLAQQNNLFSIVIAITGIISFAIMPLLGSISDRWSRKKMMLILLSLTILSYLLLLIGISWQSFLMIVLAKTLNGVASQSQPIAEAAITDQKTGWRRSYGIALISVAMTLALVLGPLAGGYLSDPHLVHWFTLKTPLYSGLLLSVLSIVIILYGYYDKPLSHTSLPGASSITKPMLKKKKPISRQLFGYFAMFFFMQLSWALFYQAVPLYFMQKFHWVISQTSLFLSIMGLIMAGGLFFIYYGLAKTKRYRLIAGTSFIISLISAVGFLYAKQSLGFYLWGSVLSLFVGLYYPALITLMTYEVSNKHYGWLMGCNTALMGLAWLIAGSILGVLINTQLNLPLILQTIAIAVASLLMLLPKKAQAVQY